MKEAHYSPDCLCESCKQAGNRRYIGGGVYNINTMTTSKSKVGEITRKKPSERIEEIRKEMVGRSGLTTKSAHLIPAIIKFLDEVCGEKKIVLKTLKDYSFMIDRGNYKGKNCKNICRIEGCNNYGEYKGIRNGIKVYRKICEFHRWIEKNSNRAMLYLKRKRK